MKGALVGYMATLPLAALSVAAHAGCADVEGAFVPLDAGNTNRTDGAAADARPSGLDAEADVRDSGTSDGAGPDGEGPRVTGTVSSTGYVRIFRDAAFASFYEDDVVLRSTDAPDCVTYVRSATKLASSAGIITIGGDAVGQDGGPPTLVTVPPPTPPDYSYARFMGAPPFFFAPASGQRVQVESAGTATVPAVPATTLRAPVFAPVSIVTPAIPDAGGLVVDSKKGLDVTWTVQDAGAVDQRIILFMEVVAQQRRLAQVICGFPYSRGSARVSTTLLAAVRAELGAFAVGTVMLHTGGWSQVSGDGVTHVVQVAETSSTSFDTQQMRLD